MFETLPDFDKAFLDLLNLPKGRWIRRAVLTVEVDKLPIVEVEYLEGRNLEYVRAATLEFWPGRGFEEITRA